VTITIELANEEIAEIKQITKLPDDSEAVSKAVREFLRLHRLCELKAVSGMVEFEAHWQHPEALEFGESGFPH
jgi:hypothetical protein